MREFIDRRLDLNNAVLDELYTIILKGKRPPSSLEQKLFGIVWNLEDQKNEFKKSDQKPCLTRFNRIVKTFRPRPKMNDYL